VIGEPSALRDSSRTNTARCSSRGMNFSMPIEAKCSVGSRLRTPKPRYHTTPLSAESEAWVWRKLSCWKWLQGSRRHKPIRQSVLPDPSVGSTDEPVQPEEPKSEDAIPYNPRCLPAQVMEKRFGHKRP
jgi:hypothetical protein